MPKLSKHDKLSNSRVKLTVEITPEEIEAAQGLVFERLKKDIALKGFRKGEAPDHLVLSAIGPEKLTQHTLQEVLTKSYPEVIGEAKIIPLSDPKITLETPDAAKKGTIIYSAEVDVYPQVTIKDFEAIRVTKAAPGEVTDEEVTKVVDELREKLAEQSSKAQPAENGDLIEIDYEGAIDGQVLPELSSSNHPIRLGSTELVPGFEKELLGLKLGEKKTFAITYPKDFPNNQFAGKIATFSVNCKTVYSMILPELTDELASRVGFATLLELKTKFRENLVKEKTDAAQAKFESEVIKELLARTTVEIPQTLVEQQIDLLVNNMGTDLARMGGNMVQYLEHRKLSMEEFRKELIPQAEQEIRVGLSLAYVAKHEGYEPKPADPEAEGEEISVLRKALDRLLEIAGR